MHLFNVLGRKRDDNHVKFRNHVDECHLELHLTLVVSGAGLDLLDPFM